MTRQPTPNVLDAVLGPVDAELSPLTTWEGGRLAHLERIIEAGLQTFYDVGGALMEIREGRLYRQTHRSFEAYTKERWGMGKSRAHQLIEAASTVAAISGPVVEGEPSTIVDTLPTNESQVRPLAGLDEQVKREVWAEAVATAPAGKVTGRHVEETVRRLFSADLVPLVQSFINEAWAHELPENPSHTNGTFWQRITAWFHSQVSETWTEADLKFAIKQVAAERKRRQMIREADQRMKAEINSRYAAPVVVDVEPSPKPSTIVDTADGVGEVDGGGPVATEMYGGGALPPLDRKDELRMFVAKFEGLLGQKAYLDGSLQRWGDLTGRHTETTEAERGLRKLLAITRRELAILEGQTVPEGETWGEL